MIYINEIGFLFIQVLIWIVLENAWKNKSEFTELMFQITGFCVPLTLYLLKLMIEGWDFADLSIAPISILIISKQPSNKRLINIRILLYTVFFITVSINNLIIEKSFLEKIVAKGTNNKIELLAYAVPMMIGLLVCLACSFYYGVRFARKLSTERRNKTKRSMTIG